jgi:excisionase family DNA binding protein
MSTNDSALLTTQEAAEFLRLSVPTLERMRSLGTGPDFIRLGQGKRCRIAYRRTDLDAFLEVNTFTSTQQYAGG